MASLLKMSGRVFSKFGVLLILVVQYSVQDSTIFDEIWFALEFHILSFTFGDENADKVHTFHDIIHAKTRSCDMTF